jgi:hypothetical protein
MSIQEVIIMKLYDGDVFRKHPECQWDKDNYTEYEVFYHDDYGQVPHIRMHFVGAVCGGYTPRIEELHGMIKLGNVYTGYELKGR